MRRFMAEHPLPEPPPYEEQGVDPDTLADDDLACEGHPSGPYDPMGLTVYCDGTCRR
jgi:hypothetical protein